MGLWVIVFLKKIKKKLKSDNAPVCKPIVIDSNIIENTHNELDETLTQLNEIKQQLNNVKETEENNLNQQLDILHISKQELIDLNSITKKNKILSSNNIEETLDENTDIVDKEEINNDDAIVEATVTDAIKDLIEDAKEDAILEKTNEETVEVTNDETVEKTIEDTVEDTAEETVEETVEETNEETVEETNEETVEETNEEIVEEEPVDETVEEETNNEVVTDIEISRKSELGEIIEEINNDVDIIENK